MVTRGGTVERRLGFRRPVGAVALAAALALGAGACGGDDDDDGSAASTESTESTLATPTTVATTVTTVATTATTVPADPVARGARLVSVRGCTACHSIDGKPLTGPTWQGLAGSQVKLNGGRTVTANDAYLGRSILQPAADVVDGFSEGVMPTSNLTPAEVDDILAYLKSL